MLFPQHGKLFHLDDAEYGKDVVIAISGAPVPPRFE